MEVRSRLKGAPIGTHLVISGSRVELQEPDVCDTGTSIMVKNLFFNVPARRKFMKSDSVELANIMREFERLALVNPGLRMSIDTGIRTIELRKGTMLQRIGEIWKNNITSQLIPVEADTPTVRISGFVTRPEFARRRNLLQFFLVNGRNMRHPYFKKAVLNCFNGLIAPDTAPCFFIKFDIDPAAIDVNIHPTKDEIKFEEESVIWSVLTAAVKASLGKNAAVPSIDFEAETLPVNAVVKKNEPTLPDYEIPADYNPFASAAAPSAAGDRSIRPAGAHSNPATDWEKLYEGFMGNAGHQSRPATPPIMTTEPSRAARLPEMEPDEAPNVDETLQFDDKYIIASIPGKGVAVIDQYRAHVKVLYEQLVRRMEAGQPVSQSLLFPVLLEISPEQESALESVLDPMRLMGLHVEKEGSDYVITDVPPGVSTETAMEIVRRLTESVADGASHYGAESTADAAAALRLRVALSMARSMAVTRGRALTPEERIGLVNDLFALPDPSLTPGGRRIYALLDAPSIERLLP